MCADALSLNPVPRKTHKKTKSGCRACKQRKIKCDEVKPVCNNCTRRYGKDDQAICDYVHARRKVSLSAISTVSSCFAGSSRPPHSRTRSDGETPGMIEGLSHFVAADEIPRPGTSSTKANINIPVLDTPTCLRPLISCDADSQSRSELDLFRHFMSSTCYRMPLSDQPDLRQMWTVKVPYLALRCSFLLESLAMIAAFHLRSEDPTNESLIFQSHHFYSLALRSTRDELGRICPSNAEQLVISSLLLSIASWRFRTNSTETYTVPTEAFQTSIAAVQVYLSTWPLLESNNSTVHGLFSSLDFTEKGNEVHNKRRYSDVAAMLDRLEDTSSEDRKGEELIRYLVLVHSCLYQAASKEGIRHRVVQAALNPPKSLIQGLQVKDPQALAVWARIISLWTDIEGIWWTADIAEYELRGIQQVFHDCGYNEELLSWPLARLS